MVYRLRLEDELKIEEIEEPYRTIADKIGIQNLLRLSKQFGGMSIYIPKPDTLLRQAKYTLIKKEFNGYNHAQLARKYNLSEKWIRNICGDGHCKGQMTIYDFENYDNNGTDS